MPSEIPNSKVLITSQAEQLIIGTGLGDGCIQVPFKNPRLSVVHRIEDLGYLRWKYGILKSVGLIRAPILFPNYENSATLYTICHSSLWEYRCMLYKNGGKVLSRKVLEMLTPFSLAIWYMDDGNFTLSSSKRSARITIYTLAFSKEENDLASAYLSDKFGFLFMVKPYRTSYVLQMVRGKAVAAFMDTVRPYIHPTMVRKCPDVNIVTERRFCEEAKRKLKRLAAERNQAEVMRARVRKLWQDPNYKARWHLARCGT